MFKKTAIALLASFGALTIVSMFAEKLGLLDD